MKRMTILGLALLTLSAPGRPLVAHRTSSECLPIIGRRFQKVSAGNLIFYEVNSDYFLRAEFRENCELSRINVSPKYSWDYLNSDWKEPGYLVGLSDDQYTQLLTRIDQIKPLGSLVRKGKAGEVTNATLWLFDGYTKAYVERGVHYVLGDQDGPMKIKSFSVYFLRPVRGRVSDKRVSGRMGPDRRARLKIDGKWYWVDESDYWKAVMGKQGVFRAAGPVG